MSKGISKQQRELLKEIAKVSQAFFAKYEVIKKAGGDYSDVEAEQPYSGNLKSVYGDIANTRRALESLHRLGYVEYQRDAAWSWDQSMFVRRVSLTEKGHATLSS